MKLSFTGCLIMVFCTCAVAQNKESLTPRLFQEGIISKGDYESHPAFSPTGDTIYFIKTSYDLQVSAICVSYLVNKFWTTPKVASFSGKYMDADPFVAKDGKTIYFMSNRPIKDGDPVKEDTDIWKVILTPAGWSKAIHLEAPINSPSDEYYPTLSDNGNMYFGSTRKDGNKGGSDIYRCRLINGKFQEAENLGDSINTTGNDYEAFIAPDESYLIYNSTPNTLSRLDFYISFNIKGVWTKARKLPIPLNTAGIEWSPKVTRDKKTFYFSSTRNRWSAIPIKAENMTQLNRRLQNAGNGLGDIYTIDFSAVENLK
jgi:Tol biopolymer transport system component